jgi:hypothetical protein
VGWNTKERRAGAVMLGNEEITKQSEIWVRQLVKRTTEKIIGVGLKTVYQRLRE